MQQVCLNKKRKAESVARAMPTPPKVQGKLPSRKQKSSAGATRDDNKVLQDVRGTLPTLSVAAAVSVGYRLRVQGEPVSRGAYLCHSGVRQSFHHSRLHSESGVLERLFCIELYNLINFEIELCRHEWHLPRFYHSGLLAYRVNNSALPRCNFKLTKSTILSSTTVSIVW